MSYVVYCAACQKQCNFIKNDEPKKEEIYGLCEACASEDEEYTKKKPTKRKEKK